MTFPIICSTLIYRKQVTPEWLEFWKHERRSGAINLISSCPWRYVRVKNATDSDCGNIYAMLHPLAQQNCIDLDQSSALRRIHSHGKCIALRSKCECSKAIGYTCSYPIDIPAGPADKRSDDKCNVTKIRDGEDATKIIKLCENETETQTDGKAVSTTVLYPTDELYVTEKPYTKKPQHTKKPESDILVPPFLKGGIPPFLRGNNFQMGPPSFLQRLNPQLGVPPLLRPSQFNMNSNGMNMNGRNSAVMNRNETISERDNDDNSRQQ